MIYQLKQKMWSFAPTYEIRDADGKLALTVKGKILALGDQLTVMNPSGQEVAYIRERLLHLLPHYEIYREDQLFATIQKQFTWFRSRFLLDTDGPNDLSIDGNFFDYDFIFLRGDTEIATVSKKFWSWADTYGVEIREGEDDVAILATVVVIDLCCHQKGAGGGAAAGGS